jgi:hypothetical protein
VGLPVAAAVFDRNGIIVPANRHFDRLCGRIDPTRPEPRFADIVV